MGQGLRYSLTQAFFSALAEGCLPSIPIFTHVHADLQPSGQEKMSCFTETGRNPCMMKNECVHPEI